MSSLLYAKLHLEEAAIIALEDKLKMRKESKYSEIIN
jgi:hypothetical protein